MIMPISNTADVPVHGAEAWSYSRPISNTAAVPVRGAELGSTLICTHTSLPAAIYEPSCEAYKHQGRSSDSYWIDPDGSGPLSPFKVNCNMTGECVWAEIGRASCRERV